MVDPRFTSSFYARCHLPLPWLKNIDIPSMIPSENLGTILIETQDRAGVIGVAPAIPIMDTREMILKHRMVHRYMQLLKGLSSKRFIVLPVMAIELSSSTR